MNRLALLTPGRQPVCGKCKADLDASGAPGHADLAELERAVASSPAPVLVDFWAPWCGPCRMQGPILEEVAAAVGDKAVVAKINIDENTASAAQFGVQSIPTLLLFKDGSVVKEYVGVQRKDELVKTIQAQA
jgi:thioredoxin 2